MARLAQMDAPAAGLFGVRLLARRQEIIDVADGLDEQEGAVENQRHRADEAELQG
jgi:hypothetical protein